MVHILIRNKLKDIDKWKSIFTKNANIRKEAGSMGGHVFRNIDDNNEIVIILEWDNIRNARKFAESDALKKRMKDAGVTGIPDIYFIEEVERVDN